MVTVKKVYIYIYTYIYIYIYVSNFVPTVYALVELCIGL